MNASVLLADYERAMLAATPAGRDGGLVVLLGEGVGDAGSANAERAPGA